MTPFHTHKVNQQYFFVYLDSRSVQLKNTKGNIQRKAGKALYNLHESLPGDWQTFTDNNIRLAEQVTVSDTVVTKRALSIALSVHQLVR